MREREAHHLLQRFYKVTGGNTEAQADLRALGDLHGLADEQTAEAVDLLEARGLIRRLPTGLFSLTPAGVALIESEFGLSEI
ncbi:MAG: hypothetical protein HPY83_09725 [Anaerolineae bacterium]|nr:hypothetical protein [Anaerolineae bacterium]